MNLSRILSSKMQPCFTVESRLYNYAKKIENGSPAKIVYGRHKKLIFNLISDMSADTLESCFSA